MVLNVAKHTKNKKEKANIKNVFKIALRDCEKIDLTNRTRKYVSRGEIKKQTNNSISK